MLSFAPEFSSRCGLVAKLVFTSLFFVISLTGLVHAMSMKSVVVKTIETHPIALTERANAVYRNAAQSRLVPRHFKVLFRT